MGAECLKLRVRRHLGACQASWNLQPTRMHMPSRFLAREGSCRRARVLQPAPSAARPSAVTRSNPCSDSQPGMATAAAFLETRRYAAYLGATVEFSK